MKIDVLLVAAVLVAGFGALGATGAIADQVIPDDLIITNSVCVGFDCVDGENFGFTTVKLKENNLRILFEDTSVGAFPTNDFAIEVNDTASGGHSYFQIVDRTAGTTLLRLCAVADTTCENILPAGLGVDPQTAVNTSVIAEHGERLDTLDSQVADLGEGLAVNKDGVALAIALGGGVPLMPEQRFTIGVNYGNFDGAGAIGVSGGARLNNNATLNGGLGMGFGTGAIGGRVGMQLAW